MEIVCMSILRHKCLKRYTLLCKMQTHVLCHSHANFNWKTSSIEVTRGFGPVASECHVPCGNQE